MAARIFLTLTLVFVATQPLWGQSLASQCRAAGGATPADAQGPVIPATANMPAEPPPSPTLAPPLAPEAPSPRRSITRVTNGSGSLPNERGQVWREYDISPYTTRITSTRRPEQAVVDSILRETGYEVWHSEPLGILSATPRTLRVYHTPQMQALVANVVDRFVASEAQTETFCLRVMTIDSPELAHPRPAGVAARARADPRRLRLAVAEGGRRRAPGRLAAAERLPRTQLPAPDGQQRAIDGRFHAAAADLRAQRHPAAGNGLRLREPHRPDRRRLLFGVQSVVDPGRADDRRGDQVQHRSGGEDHAGDDRGSHGGLDAQSGRGSTRRKCRTSASTSGFAGRPSRCS